MNAESQSISHAGERLNRHCAARRFVAALIRAWDLPALWQERSRQRRQLLALDARMLKDIGISRTDAWREAAKPFWQE